MRIAPIVVVITLLVGHARADESGTDDGGGTPVASPWIDLHPANVLTNAANQPAPETHKVAAAATVGGLYAGFIGWMYYAWYNKHKPLSQYKFGGDGWLGLETYAGGADKFGHAWATMSLGRLGTEMLSQWGGYDRTTSVLIGTGLSEALFVGVEVKDGFFYEFSFSDLTGDSVGMLLSLAMGLSPRLDEMFDYRVQYFPSAAYGNQIENANSPTGGKLNIAEDYSGQTYMLAFHLASIHSLRDSRWGTVARWVDVIGAFETRGYKPTPASGELPPDQHHQNMFIGLSFNAQGFLDWAFEGRHDKIRKVTHGLFEVFNLPYSSVGFPGLDLDRSPGALPMMGGA